MNRFLTRKKKDDESGGPGKKKGKKGQAEAPKLELDLTSALPSSDNFRTSLIMPTLNARFSMLREQDDPNSKIGKASDDSVLSPKRQSRLHEFGFRPGVLGDIAEVSSINGSVAAPFAESARQGSVSSSAADDTSADNGGSIMSRARPGEGNILFGGRQRIYMIPASGSTKTLGRALYEDDVHMSVFQKHRKQEKEEAERQRQQQQQQQRQQQQQLLQQDDDDQPLSEAIKHPPYSPTASEHSHKRETTSSDTSGPSVTRTSTAATSVISNSSNQATSSVSTGPTHGQAAPLVERSMTKGRRLYEQGLNQHIHDQQHSALTRLNTLHKGQVNGRATPPLFQARSNSSLNERFNRQASNSIRNASPTIPSGFTNAATLGSSKEPTSSGSSPIIPYAQSPPLSPISADGEAQEALHSALSPSDRGKATALGAFNRPNKQYDESQYVQRLQNLQQGREPQLLRRDTSASSTSLTRAVDTPSHRNPSAGFRTRSPSQDRTAVERSRSASNASAGTTGPTGLSVFQRAANLMKAANPDGGEQTPSTGKTDPAQRTFFASPNDSEEDVDRRPRGPVRNAEMNRRLQSIRKTSPSPNRPAPPLHEHPALRSKLTAEPIPEIAAPSEEEDDEALSRASEESKLDSPTLGEHNGGLSGLIRQHLRNVSNVSSVYTEAPPPEPLAFHTRDLNRRLGSETDTPAHSSHSHSNPWDLEELDGTYYGEVDSLSSTSPVDHEKPKVHRLNGGSRTSTMNSSATSGFHDHAGPRSVMPEDHKELHAPKHDRNGSTETQHERDAIAAEMRRRQKAIEEMLSASKEDDSPQDQPSGARRALTMLRTKQSRDSVVLKQQEPAKAMKMLGLSKGGADMNMAPRANNDSSWRKDIPQAQQPQAIPHDRLDAVRARKLQGRPSQDRPSGERVRQRPSMESAQNPPQHMNRSPPSSTKSSTKSYGRNRSSSEVSSGRSRSRHGRYRDDLDKAMAEGTGSMTAALPERSLTVPQHILEAASRSTPNLMSYEGNVQTRPRGRSNSKSQGPAYFDQKSLHPIYTGPVPMQAGGLSPHMPNSAQGPFPGLSPGLPPSPRPSPGLHSPGMFMPRPSPVAAYSANSTPPISNPTTPVPAGFSGSTSPLVGAGGGGSANRPTSAPRKKSVNKHDISEPRLISKTSTVDLVDLPQGASLKNGMNDPPPVPPINPRRRRFGFGRTESHESANSPPHSEASTPFTSPQPPQAPFMSPPRTMSGDEGSARPREPRRLRKASSEGHSLRAQASHLAVNGSSPALPQNGFGSSNGSPPRPTSKGVMF